MKLISEYGNEIVETDDINKIERLKSLNFRELTEAKKEVDDKELKKEESKQEKDKDSSKKTQSKKVNPSTKGRSKKNGNKKEA